MLKLKVTTKFKKDYKRMKKQGKDMTLLEGAIEDLLAEKTWIRNILTILYQETM